MKYLIVDLEATDTTTGTSEIIEFGYAIIEDGKIATRGGSFIKPAHSSLTPFIKELTSITEEDLESAPSFTSFFDAFFSNFNPKEYIFVGWGNYDIKMVNTMCRLWGLDFPKFKGHMNLKNQHKNFYGFKEERSLGRALRHANIQFEGTPHRGSDDAYNSAKLFLDLIQKGWVPKFDEVPKIWYN